MNKKTQRKMRVFREFFNRLFISITDTDVAMLGSSHPIIEHNDMKWAEFTIWANLSFNPNIEIDYSYMQDDQYVCACLNSDTPWTSKSHSTIKSHFSEYILEAKEDYDPESGQPLGACLLLKIPIT